MGATSVTGTGVGAGEPNKGPLNNRSQYVSILDPHIVYSGTFYNNDGTETVYLPEFVWDVPEKLTVLCSGKTYAVDKLVNGDGLMTSFNIQGAKKREVDFVVIKDASAKFCTDF